MTPHQYAEIQAVAHDLRKFGLMRSANRLEALLGEVNDERPCPVQSNDGVRAIPWGLAEMLYAGYASEGHGSQSLERMADRGGFGRRELGALAVDAYGSMHGGHERPGRLPRWPLLDLYDMARTNLQGSEH